MKQYIKKKYLQVLFNMRCQICIGRSSESSRNYPRHGHNFVRKRDLRKTDQFRQLTYSYLVFRKPKINE